MGCRCGTARLLWPLRCAKCAGACWTFRPIPPPWKTSGNTLRRLDERVLVDGYELTVALARSRRVAPDGGFVFAVGGDEGGAFLEYSFQYGAVVDQHVSGGEPMKTLTPQTRRGSVLSTSSRLSLDAPMKRVVHGADFSGAFVLVFEELLRQCLRDRVGHLHERGDASGRCCSGFGSDFPLWVNPGSRKWT